MHNLNTMGVMACMLHGVPQQPCVPVSPVLAAFVLVVWQHPAQSRAPLAALRIDTGELQCAQQVYFHLTVRREDGERVLETTRLREEGVEGSGVPCAFVLGKGLRAPRGWELAISSERPKPARRLLCSPCAGCLLDFCKAHQCC